MAKIYASPRERFALFLILNPMQHNNRQERKRADRIFDALELGAIGDTVDRLGGQTTHLGFSPIDGKDYELTSDQRDLLISFLDRPVSLAIGRLVKRLESDLIKGRDGESSAPAPAAAAAAE